MTLDGIPIDLLRDKKRSGGRENKEPSWALLPLWGYSHRGISTFGNIYIDL